MWFWKGRVRCIDCGFLEPPYVPGEATPKLRRSIQDGKAINGMGINEYLRVNYLVCHRRALGNNLDELNTILGERDCKYFYLYKQGYSPAQHLQMQDNERRDRRNWYRDIITATVFTVLGAILTLLIIWVTSR
jgi:hypothetical protein